MFLILFKNIAFVFILNNSAVLQSYITEKVIVFFSDRYDLDLSFKKVYLKFPNKIVLSDIKLMDQQGDTLIYSGEISAKISAIKIFERKLYLDRISLIDTYFNVIVDSSGVANYTYLVDKFSSEDTDTTPSKGFDIFCNDFEIVNAKFKYKDYSLPEVVEGFDATNIELAGINLWISDFQYFKDTIEFDLNEFNLAEQSGIDLREISAHIKYYNEGIELSDFVFKTANSLFVSSQIKLEGSGEDYLSDPLNKLKLDINIDTLIFDIADLGPFMPEYKHLHDKLYLSGKFSGKLSKFRFRNFNISYGDDTRIVADLSVDGLPDMDMTFVFGSVTEFTTSNRDIRRIMFATSPKKPVVLPSAIDNLGNISFTGNLTGLFNDLVAYGEFTTGLGSLNTDINLVTDFETFDIGYSGKLNANKLDLGKITGDPANFGFASFKSEIRGNLDSLGNFNANVDFDITELGLLNYNYSSIKIIGDVSNSFFDGELYITDPNLKVEFFGKYNYGQKDQEIDFSTDIWANLNNLNITNDSLGSEIKLALSCDLKGDLLNAPEGNVYLSHFNYKAGGKELKLQQLSLNSYIDEFMQQYLTVRSDYLDVNFYGSFIFSEMGTVIYNMIANYAPAFFDPIKIDTYKSSNVANFDARLKKLNNLTNIFLEELNIDNDIFIEGKISGKDDVFEAILSLPVIKYDSIYLWGSELNIIGYSDSLDLVFTAQEISTKSFPLVENLLMSIDFENDSVFLSLEWDNFDPLRNAGDVRVSSKFIVRPNNPIPLINTIIHDSQVVIENLVWDISRTPVTIDGSEINISRFSLTHENQVLNIDGDISENETKLLRFLVNNVDISNFNSYISSTGYSLDGILSGNGRVANIYNSPSFRSSLSINDFKINSEDFGRFDLSATWEGNTNGFRVDGVNKYMRIRGSYDPETDSIDVNFLIDNFKLDILDAYMREYDVSELKGLVDVSLEIGGVLANPEIKGYIAFEKTEFIYDFLKIKLSTDDKITITNNAILFEDFKIYDENKKLGTINGGVYHKNFSDISFDLAIDAKNMKLLNTSERDNGLYYGTAYGTGTVKIAGNIDKFGIDIVAKTEPNTVFVLPMTESYESGTVNFVTFIQRVSDDAAQEIKPLSSSSEYYFKMDIEITPDAEVQIVFDPKVGDLIKGNAIGNVKMEYTSDEEFYMYGEVEIIEGDYLFTLENIINKKFHIKPGGTIFWSGDPYEAVLDLDAIYMTRAPLSDLMAEVTDSLGAYNKAVNVECHMNMSGNLMAPDIQFGISIPSANEKAKAQLANLTQDEINKQMLYLLILNRFYSTAQSSEVGGPQMGSTTNAFGVTSSEMLSNQLSNWLSQISKDFDIGFKYRPGSDVSGQELEVALSTQILNDRVLINGNVGIGENKSNTSNLIGDIEVQLKVNQSGSFRLKGFTRANDDLEAEFGPYTNGVGVFYTEDFDTIGELMRKFWSVISFKNARDKRSDEKVALSEKQLGRVN